MLAFTFMLNSQPASYLTGNGTQYKAFSGKGDNVNKVASMCTKDGGAIPPALYYIVDRPTGGRLGPIKDFFSGKDEWFALFAADGTIDDKTLCNKVERGEFRLHPIGPRGISNGCITLFDKAEFNALRSLLLGTKTEIIRGTNIKYYGTILVMPGLPI